MNPITFNEYENYMETQKKAKKDNDLRNCATSRFLRDVSLSRQPKEKAKEIIKEFNEANLIFLVFEADFIFHEWLTSYCNIDQEKKKKVTEAKANGTFDQSDADETDNSLDNNDNNSNNGVQENTANGYRYTLLSKKINIKPSIIKYNSSTNNIVNIDSALDQSNADQTDNAYDSLGDYDNNRKVTKVKTRGYTLSLKRENVEPSIRKHSNNIIDSALDQSDADETNKTYDSLGDNDNNGVQENAEAIANGYTLLPKRRNTKSSTRKRSNNTNNINIENATANQSDADETNNIHDSLDNNYNNIKRKKKATQAKANEYMLSLKKRNVKPSIKKKSNNTNNINIESASNQSDADETDNAHDFLGDNDHSDNTDEIPHNSNTLTSAIDEVSYTDLESITSQGDTLTLARNRLERKTRSPMHLHNTNIEDDTTNIDAGNKITANNVSPSSKSILRSSVQKHNDKKRKRGQAAKEPSSHKASVTKKTRNNKN
ncbi:hypothetical protein C2G38_2185436 [Gigaspora rosea]|uniref:Uncharacterized protein n=1 Tax=Gigaspora rosea TaxID=44941 RepID=A0A397V917_9GLOM|nr:hypothetical protein C2G38_2185436 [Gigaspora rosea]